MIIADLRGIQKKISEFNVYIKITAPEVETPGAVLILFFTSANTCDLVSQLPDLMERWQNVIIDNVNFKTQ